MINIMNIALALIFVANPMNPSVAKDDFDPANLTDNGQAAYTSLLQATQFEDARVGYAGTVSEYAKNLETLLGETNADEAFKSLLKNGTMAGRLYGLCGIFYTDNEKFQNEVENYRGSKQMVGVMSGCEIYEETVAAIIESKGKNVAVIGPGESLEQYLAGNSGQSYNIDIAGGGYQATFRHSVKEERDRKQ